jgi:hypothetical protein
MPEHDPLTCELCHAEGMGAEIAAVTAERDDARAEVERLRGVLSIIVTAPEHAREYAEAALAARRKEAS